MHCIAAYTIQRIVLTVQAFYTLKNSTYDVMLIDSYYIPCVKSQFLSNFKYSNRDKG